VEAVPAGQCLCVKEALAGGFLTQRHGPEARAKEGSFCAAVSSVIKVFFQVSGSVFVLC
jgi:hypothetical protein